MKIFYLILAVVAFMTAVLAVTVIPVTLTVLDGDRVCQNGSCDTVRLPANASGDYALTPNSGMIVTSDGSMSIFRESSITVNKTLVA